MKKFLISSILLITSLHAICQNNQAYTKPLKIANLNQDTIDIGAYLDDGKYVILDIFTTWCAPCWNSHNSSNLKDVNKFYGPNSNNYQFNVVGIEISGYTNFYDLTHETDVSYGNWLMGIEYPIVDINTGMDDNMFSSAFLVSSYPTFIMICPDRSWYEINTSNQVVTAVKAILNGEVSCLEKIEDDPALLNSIGKKYTCEDDDEIELGILHTNFGTNPATNHRLEITERMDNNQSIKLDTFSVESAKGFAEIDTFYYTLKDINPTSRYTFTLLDDSLTSLSSRIYVYPGKLDIVSDTSYVYDEENIFANIQNTERFFAFYLSRIQAQDIFPDMPLDLIIGRFDFDDMEDVVLEFSFSQASSYVNLDNKLELMYSDDCGESWQSFWFIENEDLHTFKGNCSDEPVFKSELIPLDELTNKKDILLGFKYFSNTDCRIEIQDIKFVDEGITSTGGLEFEGISIFPNPFQDLLHINTKNNESGNLLIYNIMGYCVIKEKVDKEFISFDVSTLKDGVYFAKLEGETTFYKLIKASE